MLSTDFAQDLADYHHSPDTLLNPNTARSATRDSTTGQGGSYHISNYMNRPMEHPGNPSDATNQGAMDQMVSYAVFTDDPHTMTNRGESSYSLNAMNRYERHLYDDRRTVSHNGNLNPYNSGNSSSGNCQPFGYAQVTSANNQTARYETHSGHSVVVPPRDNSQYNTQPEMQYSPDGSSNAIGSTQNQQGSGCCDGNPSDYFGTDCCGTGNIDLDFCCICLDACKFSS